MRFRAALGTLWTTASLNAGDTFAQVWSYFRVAKVFTRYSNLGQIDETTSIA